MFIVIADKAGQKFWSDSPITEVPVVIPPTQISPPVGIIYKPMLMDCGATKVSEPVKKGCYYYTFTIPAGTYTGVSMGVSQGTSYMWSEQLVIKKDGFVTKADYDALLAQVIASGKSSLRSVGVGDWWYGIAPGGSANGATISFTTSPNTPEVITRNATTRKTTFSRDVTFTVLDSIGDVGSPVPQGSTHKIWYCINK